ncbi:MsnO8 family LLM class oxidoreductase [Nocardioides sp. T2.26MG-1]|uniref:MsnO8 family LLM class oxidoreductase n=1 Tax=Nocardioides sp. T2.26MG-1 TaxID=3041166 RepID=UPI0024777D38|nr:MsnO8 family LLM class oxidoreductase [Nocardioides sp. T2.26MG-1]CAI9416208.1 F420-dependent glucose-6-phosphate dehydrogenase [Nocardioides sp. T2.26MG-1]
MRLSLLDRSRTRAGRPEAEALTGTIERAVHAEGLGYDRVWVAEHHAVPGIASGSPPVLLAAIGARTRTIRIGSGGVMLPHHQPLVVAEQFRMLDALHPGRVDLGIGRSLGFTAPVRRALRHGAEALDTFESDLAELRAYLADTAAITARPVTGRRVPVHLLATGRGLEVAARLGLPVVVGGPVLDSAEIGDVLSAYRRDFRPHEGSTPSVTVSLDVTVAETDAEARDLALPEAWAMARSRQTGEFAPLEPVDAIRAQPWTSQLRGRVEPSLDRAVLGSPVTVRRALERLAERTGADELMISTSTYDRDALFASDAAVREIVGGAS